MAIYNFSFGSNMSSNRLLARLPNAKRVGTALLKGYKLTFNMAFADGSGKCTIIPTDAVVYGVVYQITQAEKSVLDEIEGPNYDCIDLTVNLLDKSAVDVHCYVANTHDDDLLPYDWYVQHVYRGALEAGVPEHYSQRILAYPSKQDSDKNRAEIEFAVHQN